MKKEIDYKKFIKYVHDKFQDKISQKDVEKLLSLEEDYNKDSPTSLGKSLVLNRLIFNGEKISGEKIAFDKPFAKGLNTWIADNGKGKSTIFKIIKYALTGNNSLKKDIKNWINEILLEFQIGQTVYTVYVNKSSRTSEGALYSFTIEKFLELRAAEKLDSTEKHLQFSFKGDDAFSNQIQTFFFNQFSYYSLKYTQKSSKKDDLSLKTSSLSWSSYFKTIYLESSDHGNLYFKEEKIGDQGRKIFEMILGLRLTYPINRLSLLLNREEEEIGKIKIVEASTEKSNKDDKVKLDKDLEKINKDLSNLEKLSNASFDTNPLIEEQLKLQDSINKTLKDHREASSKYNNAVEEKNKKLQENDDFKRDLEVVDNEITRLEKQRVNMNLYQEAGSFFTNLEIKTCPHCETVVSQEKIKDESEHHNCRLCGTEATLQKIDNEELAAKIAKIIEEKTSYEEKKVKLKQKIANGKVEFDTLNANVLKLYSDFIKVPSTEKQQNRLKEIETSINNTRSQLNELKDLNSKKDILRDQKAVVAYRLAELAKEEPKKNETQMEQRALNKEIFIYAIDALKKKRQELNKEILTKLEGLILKEIHEFGLKNISKVEITESYNLVFMQNEESENFDDLTESEKLRVKFAFYLSLIQLDIEYQLGRHSRFLIFDSPGSEEISKANLEGLSAIFKDINKRFGNDLQIFLGTSLREFNEATTEEKATIKAPEEALF